MAKPYKLIIDALVAAVALGAAFASFLEENIGAGVTGLVSAIFMFCSILAAIFEDKDAKKWREDEREQRRIEREEEREQRRLDREQFETTMVSLGYDIYNLRQTAAHSPATFTNPPPHMRRPNHVPTPTEIERLPKADVPLTVKSFVSDMIGDVLVDMYGTDERGVATHERAVQAETTSNTFNHLSDATRDIESRDAATSEIRRRAVSQKE